MIQLVEIDELKTAIGIHFVDQDEFLDQLISAASANILAHVKSDGSEYLDTAGDLVAESVPDRLKTAVILYVRYLFDRPDIKLDELSDLPPAVISLIRDLRPVTIA